MEFVRNYEIRPDINLISIPALSSLQSTSTLGVSGGIAVTGGEHVLTTGTSANSSAVLQTKQRASALPGEDTLVSISARIPTSPTGNHVVRWGLYDDNEGVGFGKDATGFFIFTRTGGVDTKTYQTSWSIDKVNGSGVSGKTLDATVGTFYQIRFTWYGTIEWAIDRPSEAGEQIIVHRYRAATNPIFATPYLPLRADAVNGSTTSNVTLAVGVRCVSQIVGGTPARRAVSHTRRAVSLTQATDSHVMSFKRKTGAYSTLPVKLKSIDVFSNEALELSFYTGATLTSPSYGDPNGIATNESCCQVDSSATISSGTLFYKLLIPASTHVSHVFDSDIFHPSEVSPITLIANPYGASPATATFNLRWSEQW